MNAVTFVEKNSFHTYRFSTIIHHGCSAEFVKCLEYAYKKIKAILLNNVQDNL